MRFLNRTAGHLSRHRRRSAAGLVVLLLGLLTMGGFAALVSPTQAQPAQADEELIAEGRELFLVGCSFCHGQNGEGVPTVNGNQLGPSLVGVGAAAVDFQVGTGRMPMAQPGAQAPPKQVAYTDEEIEALAAYVASLGPGPAIPEETTYDPEAALRAEGLSGEELEEAQQESVTRGGEIFLANCSACHNFEGSGGAMPQGGEAPSLHGSSRKHIYEAMLTGPGNMPNFSNGNLPPEDKRDVIAYLKSINANPGYGGFQLGGLGPVSEGMFAWVVGIGGAIGFAVWIAAHTTRSSKKKVSA